MGQDLFGSMAISAAGMSAQRTRMVAIAKNIANAETTRSDNGEPYRRRQAVFSGGDQPAVEPLPPFEHSAPLARTSPQHLEAAPMMPIADGVPAPAVEAHEVVDANAGFTLVYDPQHPDAGKDGYVRLPDINTVTEMVDMVAATRAYEANLAAMKAYQNIASKSLEI